MTAARSLIISSQNPLLYWDQANNVHLVRSRWKRSDFFFMAMIAQLKHNLLMTRPIRKKWLAAPAPHICCGLPSAGEWLQLSTTPLYWSGIDPISNSRVSSFSLPEQNLMRSSSLLLKHYFLGKYPVQHSKLHHSGENVRLHTIP